MWELFGEVNVPLLKDQPFAYLLSVGAAGRYSDYWSVGGTRAYQFNAIYAPVEDVSFRGSYGRWVRAPNIAELYRPRTGFTDFISDPCFIPNRGRGTQFREANCRAIISGLGGDPTTFEQGNNPDQSGQVIGSQQGNANLRAEAARTWTAGVVLRPGLRAALADRGRLVQHPHRGRDQPAECGGYRQSVRRPAVDRQSPLRRDHAAAGDGLYQRLYRPAAERRRLPHRGAGGERDLPDRDRRGGGVRPAPRRRLTDWSNCRCRVTVVNNVDQPFRPQYTVTFSPTWTIETLTLAYNLRWQNGVRQFDRVSTDRNPNLVDPRFFRFKELWQHDVQAELRANDDFAFYAGVNNLFDQKPDMGSRPTCRSRRWGSLYAGARAATLGGRRWLLGDAAPHISGHALQIRHHDRPAASRLRRRHPVP
ncbi:TonB-dependent receptor domain-containing protein [Sphingomonas sp. MMS24-JH45]